MRLRLVRALPGPFGTAAPQIAALAHVLGVVDALLVGTLRVYAFLEIRQAMKSHFESSHLTVLVAARTAHARLFLLFLKGFVRFAVPQDVFVRRGLAQLRACWAVL